MAAIDIKADNVKKIMDKIKYNDRGLIPAVLQDYESGEVLMLAYMNKKAFKKTIETGKACFWSRSRQEIWLKGNTSGNYQEVQNIYLDCDGDALLVQVKPEGPACHTGEKSCFFQHLAGADKEDFAFQKKASFLQVLSEVIAARKKELPENSYTTYLFEKGIDKITKKLAEEAAEVIIAAKNEDEEEIIYESADLIYHLLVLLESNRISVEQIFSELKSRHDN